MTQYSDFEDILLQYNWTGNGKAGYTTALPNTALTPNGSGVYEFSYNFLLDQNSVLLAGYNSSDAEYS